MYKKNLPNDIIGYNALYNIREKNNQLLVNSNKDLGLLKSVVGDIEKYEK